jgi:hypothetical protein
VRVVGRTFGAWVGHVGVVSGAECGQSLWVGDGVDGVEYLEGVDVVDVDLGLHDHDHPLHVELHREDGRHEVELADGLLVRAVRVQYAQLARRKRGLLGGEIKKLTIIVRRW